MFHGLEFHLEIEIFSFFSLVFPLFFARFPWSFLPNALGQAKAALRRCVEEASRRMLAAKQSGAQVIRWVFEANFHQNADTYLENWRYRIRLIL
jgi:hypothetical protein